MAWLETSCPYEAKPIQFDIWLIIPKYKAQLYTQGIIANDKK
jgi:hypothetical protein